MQDNIKTLRVYKSNGLRDLVGFANEKGLTKDSIVNIFPDTAGHEFILVYFA